MTIAAEITAMPVYCDDPIWPRWHGNSGHLIATSLAELHLLAEAIGLDKRCFFGHALVVHYQLPESQRDAAIAAGAIPLARQEFMREVNKIASGQYSTPVVHRDRGSDPLPRRRRQATPNVSSPAPAVDNNPQQPLF